MTIALCTNPAADKVFVGLQGEIIEARYSGTGAIAASFAVLEQSASVIHSRGTGALSLKAPALALIAVQPRIARGAGDLVTPKVALAGDTGTTQHPAGNGTVIGRGRFAGTAVRKIPPDLTTTYETSFQVTGKLGLAGEADIASKYIVGDGELNIGTVVFQDIPIPAGARTLRLDAVFDDVLELDAVFAQTIYLDGLA